MTMAAYQSKAHPLLATSGWREHQAIGYTEHPGIQGLDPEALAPPTRMRKQKSR
jgi:hypothetical protein